MTKVKVLWVGDGVIPTGFSTVNHNIIKNLPEDSYEVHHLAVNYYGDPHEYKHKIYPAAKPEHYAVGDVLGFARLSELAAKIKPDIIFILNDVWVVAEYLRRIKAFYKENVKLNIPKIVVYFPVDGAGYNPKWFDNFDIVSQTVVYTEFGNEVVKTAIPELDLKIIPHGIDKESFKKLYDTRLEARKTLSDKFPKLLEDSFIVLNANRNQIRKRIDLSIMGFALFAKDKPKNVLYYHHAGLRDAGWDVPAMVKGISKELGINLESRMIFSNKNKGIQAVTVENLNKIYNICDVGINVSTGEGWGLTSMEHAITGAVQIVPAHSACIELFNDCGVVLQPSVRTKEPDTSLDRYLVSAETVAEGLNLVYNDPKLKSDLEQKAMNKFNLPKYDWVNIASEWDNVFKSVL